ncbi:GreA/GreB family elongation factor, partial [Pseudocitrobacter faecalis]
GCCDYFANYCDNKKKPAFHDISPNLCRAYYARKNLVYPNEVKSNDDISIFAPVGSALLGLAAGQTLTWPMPGGAEKTIEILEVVYQPEREGDFSR